jgi:hypothetical protein
MPLNYLTHLIHQFVLVILLVKVNKSYFVLKEKMSRHTWGGRESEKCHHGEGGGGSNKCGKSVTTPVFRTEA